MISKDIVVNYNNTSTRYVHYRRCDIIENGFSGYNADKVTRHEKGK